MNKGRMKPVGQYGAVNLQRNKPAAANSPKVSQQVSL